MRPVLTIPNLHNQNCSKGERRRGQLNDLDNKVRDMALAIFRNAALRCDDESLIIGEQDSEHRVPGSIPVEAKDGDLSIDVEYTTNHASSVVGGCDV